MKDQTKCTGCKLMKKSDEFIKDDKVLKTCDKCREKDIIYRKNKQCQHGRSKSTCKEAPCNGNSRCFHGKIIYHCKNCKEVNNNNSVKQFSTKMIKEMTSLNLQYTKEDLNLLIDKMKEAHIFVEN